MGTPPKPIIRTSEGYADSAESLNEVIQEVKSAEGVYHSPDGRTATPRFMGGRCIGNFTVMEWQLFRRKYKGKIDEHVNNAGDDLARHIISELNKEIYYSDYDARILSSIDELEYTLRRRFWADEGDKQKEITLHKVGDRLEIRDMEGLPVGATRNEDSFTGRILGENEQALVAFDRLLTGVANRNGAVVPFQMWGPWADHTGEVYSDGVLMPVLRSVSQRQWYQGRRMLYQRDSLEIVDSRGRIRSYGIVYQLIPFTGSGLDFRDIDNLTELDHYQLRVFAREESQIKSYFDICQEEYFRFGISVSPGKENTTSLTYSFMVLSQDGLQLKAYQEAHQMKLLADGPAMIDDTLCTENIDLTLGALLRASEIDHSGHIAALMWRVAGMWMNPENAEAAGKDLKFLLSFTYRAPQSARPDKGGIAQSAGSLVKKERKPKPLRQPGQASSRWSRFISGMGYLFSWLK